MYFVTKRLLLLQKANMKIYKRSKIAAVIKVNVWSEKSVLRKTFNCNTYHFLTHSLKILSIQLNKCIATQFDALTPLFWYGNRRHILHQNVLEQNFFIVWIFIKEISSFNSWDASRTKVVINSQYIWASKIPLFTDGKTKLKFEKVFHFKMKKGSWFKWMIKTIHVKKSYTNSRLISVGIVYVTYFDMHYYLFNSVFCRFRDWKPMINLDKWFT